MEGSNEALTLLGVFLMGLGLNLTPCVYPMLSVTVSLFEKQKHEPRLQAFLKALIYVLGICTMYSSLGVMASLSGEVFGAWLQSRWVLLAISVLLVALALSMFGFYQFRMPGGLMKRVGGHRPAGYIGLFFSGLFVGVIAAPCVGPPVVALLTYVGTQADPMTGFSLFFVLSLGLGLPYLIFGTFSGLLAKLPKSGYWLIWVERLMGVVLFGFAGFYLVLAIDPGTLPYLVPAVLILGGIYLGFVERAEQYSPTFVQFKRFFGVTAIMLGILLPSLYPKESVQWQAYSAGVIEEAGQKAQPVILDFFAEWCIPCHELDRFTYTHPDVISVLEPFVRVKVDVTHVDSPASQEVLEKYRVPGLPYIVFLDGRGQEMEGGRIAGFVDAKEFLEVLHSPKMRALVADKQE